MELRRFLRAPFARSILFTRKDGDEFVDGAARDICLGGMFVETDAPAPFGAEVVVHTQLDAGEEEFALPGIVRWTRAKGMGVQFRPLGARPTFLITEIVRKFEEKR